MTFHTDKQTLEDLELFAESRDHLSVFSVFAETKTYGGKQLLQRIMKSPERDLQRLKERQDLIRFLHNRRSSFKVIPGEVDYLENYYLTLQTIPLHDNLIDSTIDWLRSQLKPNNNYFLAWRGVHFCRNLIRTLQEVCREVDNEFPAFFTELKQAFERLNGLSDFRELASCSRRMISFRQVSRFDQLIRGKIKPEIRWLLDQVYLLDALSAVAEVARRRHFSFPELLGGDEPALEIEGLFHPFLQDPVPNDMALGAEMPLCFVTGPNMAGKSTLLKAAGLCVYLAHLGFPVPAANMRTTVFGGLSTTINLRDDLNLGYSHFFSEVNRIRETAISLRENKHMVVIFDELFRGTNVRDAFDGTLLVVNALTGFSGSLFIISTHLTEVARDIGDPGKVSFRFLEVTMDEDKPVYSYRLREGISNERLGMYILKREKIPELLRPPAG